MDLCTYTELGMLMQRANAANLEDVGNADAGSFGEHASCCSCS